MTQSFGDPGMAGQDNVNRTANVDLTANVSGYTSQLNQAAQSTGTLSRGVDELTSRMAGLNKWAGKKLFHFAAADFTALAVASADAATFEKQLSTLAATAALTGTSLGGIKNGVESAFLKFPVARGEVVALVEAITNLGVTSVSQIGSLTQTFIKLGAATGEPMTQLASGLIQLSRLMGSTDATQIGNYANSLLTVSKNAGVSASGVLQFAQSIAPIARQAGIGEAAVIGISTAFNKAGADGFVATNTFNSMLSDITSSIATGSPQLSKYANLIGLTSEQFKKMDKTQAMVEIFNAISRQGPQAIAILNNLGIEGVRAQAAIAAITQSGNLQGSINEALGAQGNQHNLNKGANAAFNNLADSMVNVRNQFTQFGTAIGTTFLGPMTAVANVTSGVIGHLNALVKPFAPILATIAAVAGVAGGVGSIALSAAGAIGAYALVRNVGRSRFVSAFRGGMTVGGANEDLRAGRPIDRYTSGQMGFFERAGFMGGTTLRGGAARFGIGREAGPWRDPQVWRNALIAGPLGVARGLSRMNEQFLRGEMGGTPGELPPLRQRLRVWGESLQGRTMAEAAGDAARPLAAQLGRTTQASTMVGASLAQRMLRMGWALAGPTVMGALVGGTTGIPGAGTALNAGRRGLPTGSIREEFAGVRAAGVNLGESVKGIVKDTLPLKMGFVAVGNASKDLAASLLRSAGTVAGAGVGQGVRGVAAGIGGIASGVAATGGLLMRTLFSAPGMIGLLAGHALMQHADEQAHAGDVSKFLNPIQQYNDLLGTTTSNLANFNAALVQGAGAMGAMPGMTMAQAGRVNPGDQSRAPNKPINTLWSTIKDQSTGKYKDYGYLAALSALPISDPKQLQAVKEDMFAAGISEADVKKTLSMYMKAGGPGSVSGLQAGSSDWRNLGIIASNTEGAGGLNWGGDRSKSKSGGQVLGLMLSGIDSQRIADEQTTGAVYAQQNALSGYASGLAPLAALTGHGSRMERSAGSKALADALHQIAGGSTDDYANFILNSGAKTNTIAQQQQFVVNALGSTKQGKQWLSALTSHGGTLDVGRFSDVLGKLAKSPDSGSFDSLLRSQGGALGRFAAGNTAVQYAMGSGQGSPGAVNESVQALLDRAVALGHGFEGATAELSKFQGAIGDSTGVLYKQVTAAQQLAAQQAGYQAPFQTRAQNFAQTVQGFKGATQAYYSTPQAKRTDEQYQWLQTQKAAYEQSLGELQSYQQSMYQTAQSYGLQMQRAAQDENTAIFRTNQQFHIQMTQANEDYLRNRQRTQEDHDRVLINEAATAAQSIYDPYQRIQAKYTEAASTVIQLGVQQNQALAAQSANLRKLHREGLSTQAIRTLNLADPNNAAEAANLATSMTPEEAARLNRIEARRTRLTKKLTQSPENLAFSQGEADYKRQLARAEHDYDIATKRADDQHHLALANMATDYGRTVSRAGQDLTLAMTEVTGSFGTMYDRTMAQIARSVEKFSPRAAAQMRKDLTSLVQAFPFLRSGDPTQYNANAPSGSAANPSLKANTLGINPSGQIGYYDPSGRFHLDPNAPISQTNPVYIAPPSTAPVHHHHRAPAPGTAPPGGHYTGPNAAGGIATSASFGVFGEAGPEALIPLNNVGQDFMAGLIVKALGQSVRMMGPSSSSTSVDSSTNFSGPVTVVSQDTRGFEREMKAKARLRKLTSPTRRG